MTKGTMARTKVTKAQLIADIKAVAGKDRAITRAQYILNGQFKKAYETFFETFDEFRAAAKLMAPKGACRGTEGISSRSRAG